MDTDNYEMPNRTYTLLRLRKALGFTREDVQRGRRSEAETAGGIDRRLGRRPTQADERERSGQSRGAAGNSGHVLRRSPLIGERPLQLISFPDRGDSSAKMAQVQAQGITA